MQNINYAFLLSRPVWGAWIEIIGYLPSVLLAFASRPVWGAWIEMLIWDNRDFKNMDVAPRMGRVD